MKLQKSEKPASLKAAWELMELFYVDKLSQAWLPERLVDWLAVMIYLIFVVILVITSSWEIYCQFSTPNICYEPTCWASHDRIMIAYSLALVPQSTLNLWISKMNL